MAQSEVSQGFDVQRCTELCPWPECWASIQSQLQVETAACIKGVTLLH